MIGKNQKILIVGHGDIMDNSLSRYFRAQGYGNVLTAAAMGIDFTSQRAAEDFFIQHKPDYVLLGSTRSGGIMANQKNPGEFIYHNLASATNVIHLAHKCGVKKLLFFASSCVYPAAARQPLQEGYLLTGPLEPANTPYSVAKIAGIKMCQSYREQYGLNAVVMVPATLYGPEDAVNLETSHVLGALITKFHQAVKSGQKEVVVWGTGRPRREFLFVDDFISAVLFLLEQYNGGDLLNVGVGSDIAIRDLAFLTAKVAGFKGKIVFDASKPDGTMRKLLDSRRINDLGWKAKVGLEEGIGKTLGGLNKIDHSL